MVHRQQVDTYFEVQIETVEKIKNVLGEDEERLRHVEQFVEQWIRSERYLPTNYDKKMIRNFIRGSKFNVDTIKRKLEGYFSAKYAFPEFYHNRNPTSPDIAKILDVVNIVRLPKVTEKGEVICVLSLANFDATIFDMNAAIKLHWMLFDLTLTCEFPVTREIILADCRGVNPTHVVKLFCLSFKNALSVVRDAYACRLTQIHLINCPSTVETMLGTIRPLLPEKVRERFLIHKDKNSLLKVMESKMLPSDMGGTLESTRYYMEKWKDILINNSDWFEAQEEVKIVGKPPKKKQKFNNDTGLEGSFRQLNID